MKNTLVWIPSVVLLVLAGFGLVSWTQTPVSSLVNWIVGIAIFSWLLAITIVPWNVYFQAKEVLVDATLSTEQGISVNAEQQQYAVMIAQRSLWVALLLHLLSAVALYLLALWQVSAIGYFGSIAALLLTVLRPTVRTYQFLARRLAMIQSGFKYPREDVLELRGRVMGLEGRVQEMSQRLDLNNSTSWICVQQRQWEALRQDLTRLASSQEEFKAINRSEHASLSREAQQAIAQLSEDSQFLNQARELIRFIKSA
ncbi:hypothetical protein [Stenomitos frigidus]|uniref:Uncharacterized protein n=1 Tax=Stenomitos frigidus ULC18 TaxID=2107698 RepID=A0A2T1DSZ0_9CYAN|nr:hypothetical protein [Stenomitos frigidus]PSB23590.1 hypothetical protein C7B82_30370 [Stenomitos frigidus ULC18]